MCRVILIHKGGKSKEDIDNYRSIRVMNILAKIMGMVISDKIETLFFIYYIIIII